MKDFSSCSCCDCLCDCPCCCQCVCDCSCCVGDSQPSCYCCLGDGMDVNFTGTVTVDEKGPRISVRPAAQSRTAPPRSQQQAPQFSPTNTPQGAFPVQGYAYLYDSQQKTPVIATPPVPTPVGAPYSGQRTPVIATPPVPTPVGASYVAPFTPPSAGLGLKDYHGYARLTTDPYSFNVSTVFPKYPC